MLWLLVWALTSLTVTKSHPLDFLKQATATATAERAWSLWGWFWAPGPYAVLTLSPSDLILLQTASLAL
jgi:hypothetical protein